MSYRFTATLRLIGLLLVAGTLSSAAAASADTLIEADFCIYGGTSGGVVAAVQAARMGKTVVIVEPGHHLGGMTSGGLSWTDVGDSNRVGAVGGLARDVYERIGLHYGQKTGSAFATPSSAAPDKPGVDFSKPPSLAFEPHVAEEVFEAMAREAKARVIRGQPVISVRKDGAHLRELVTENGTVIRARVFLDATYEGDLMALAGVSFTVGREANAQYSETLNGTQHPSVNPRAGKFDVPIDPYVVRGQPNSGVLPYLLRPEPLGEVGAADAHVQSYNFRVCLTDDPALRLPLDAPKNYDPANYELLARWTEGMVAAGEKPTLRSFLKYDPLQKRKFAFNNRWPISTDFLGGADAYPLASRAERKQIAQAHEDYLRGFFHFLATSPRVPAAVREEMSRFGLCKDEFTETGGWPHQIYVREARRMIGSFMMTEHEVRGPRTAANSIGLGAYGVDMHAVRRIVVNGQPVNEGSNGGSVPRPYAIAYGSITPKAAECDNLFVTFCLSATHVAFGSIRMEPVFMTLSQSAATAASLVIDDRVPVQQVNYEKLRARLIADHVVLGWTSDPKR